MGGVSDSYSQISIFNSIWWSLSHCLRQFFDIIHAQTIPFKCSWKNYRENIIKTRRVVLPCVIAGRFHFHPFEFSFVNAYASLTIVVGGEVDRGWIFWWLLNTQSCSSLEQSGILHLSSFTSIADLIADFCDKMEWVKGILEYAVPYWVEKLILIYNMVLVKSSVLRAIK